MSDSLEERVARHLREMGHDPVRVARLAELNWRTYQTSERVTECSCCNGGRPSLGLPDGKRFL